ALLQTSPLSRIIKAQDGGDGGGQFGAEGQNGVQRGLGSGMDGVGEDNDESVGAGVHPHRGAGKPGVTEGTNGEESTAVAGEGGVDVPTQAADIRNVVRGLGGDHLLHGGGGENPVAVGAAAAIEHHLGELGEIVGGAKHAGIAGDAAHGGGGGVVDDAAQKAVILIALGRTNSGIPGTGR